jgi:hypothetical protein
MFVQCWNITVEDSVESPPYAQIDDFIVVVRTPRSHDFVTVEVGRVGEVSSPRASAPGVIRASRPTPWISHGWCGEVHVGAHQAVAFELDGEDYRLTLERIDTTRWRLPWGSYEFRLERHPEPASVPAGD